MLENLSMVWQLWTTIEHHPHTEFCQATDTADFKLDCNKMFLRKMC